MACSSPPGAAVPRGAKRRVRPRRPLEHLLEEKTLWRIYRAAALRQLSVQSDLRILGTLPRDRERLLTRLRSAADACAGRPDSARLTLLCSDRRLVEAAFEASAETDGIFTA